MTLHSCVCAFKTHDAAGMIREGLPASEEAVCSFFFAPRFIPPSAQICLPHTPGETDNVLSPYRHPPVVQFLFILARAGEEKQEGEQKEFRGCVLPGCVAALHAHLTLLCN